MLREPLHECAESNNKIQNWIRKRIHNRIRRELVQPGELRLKIPDRSRLQATQQHHASDKNFSDKNGRQERLTGLNWPTALNWVTVLGSLSMRTVLRRLRARLFSHVWALCCPRHAGHEPMSKPG